MMPETMLRRQRLVAENIERRARKLIVVEQREQIVVDDERAARNIDEVRAPRQPRQPRPVEQALRLARQRQQTDEYAHARKEIVELGEAGGSRDAGGELLRAAPGAKRKSERRKRRRDCSAQYAQPKDPDGELALG